MHFILIKNTGDVGYITLKAAKKMTKADVVCYDAHTDIELLKLIPKTCVQLKGWVALAHFLDRYTKSGSLTIVRMTEERDSSFVSEMHELECLGRRGYTLELIPGISNINLFSAKTQFVLTTRNRNESFWVWDGSAHIAEAKISYLINRVAPTSACIILLNPGAMISQLIALLCRYRNTAVPTTLIYRNGVMKRLRLADLQHAMPDEGQYYHLVMVHSETGV